MTSLVEVFRHFGIAVALGLLIGLERERDQYHKFAGIRTFPLITLMGCLAALIAEQFAPWTFAVAFVVVAAFVLRSYVLTGSPTSPGITTEVAAMIAFLLGGLVWWRMAELAAALAVVTVLLLATKRPLEQLAQRVGHEDILAAVQFGVITLIVLPMLPNRAFGPEPFAVLNPYRIWLMVVLIAGVNLVGYGLMRIVGSPRGFALTGILGGLASSTAVTLGFSRRSRTDDRHATALALGIVLASTIMFLRVLAVTMGVNRAVARPLALPVLVAALAGVAGCAVLWYLERAARSEAQADENLKVSNPFELWPAVQFGLIFAGILLVARAAQVYLGDRGVYASSLLAGLADVDAITLSLASLNTEGMGVTVAVRGIVLAAVANTVVKFLIVAGLGGPALRRRALPALATLAAGAIAAAFLVR